MRSDGGSVHVCRLSPADTKKVIIISFRETKALDLDLSNYPYM